MPTPKYKVGDVVLSIDGHIADEDAYASNQLCIVRVVDTYPEFYLDNEWVVYRCTTIADGRHVALYEYEIVEQSGA